MRRLAQLGIAALQVECPLVLREQSGLQINFAPLQAQRRVACLYDLQRRWMGVQKSKVWPIGRGAS